MKFDVPIEPPPAIVARVTIEFSMNAHTERHKTNILIQLLRLRYYVVLGTQDTISQAIRHGGGYLANR